MRKCQHGVTAIELMVVLVIAAILATIAIPSFSNLLARRKVEGLANELSTDIQYARAEAISRNADVTLARAADNDGYSISHGKNNAIKTVSSLPSKTTLSEGSLTFTAFRGLASDDSDLVFTVGSQLIDNKLSVVVNKLGRTEICAPGTAWGGYAKCS